MHTVTQRCRFSNEKKMVPHTIDQITNVISQLSQDTLRAQRIACENKRLNARGYGLWVDYGKKRYHPIKTEKLTEYTQTRGAVFRKNSKTNQRVKAWDKPIQAIHGLVNLFADKTTTRTQIGKKTKAIIPNVNLPVEVRQLAADISQVYADKKPKCYLLNYLHGKAVETLGEYQHHQCLLLVLATGKRKKKTFFQTFDLVRSNEKTVEALTLQIKAVNRLAKELVEVEDSDLEKLLPTRSLSETPIEEPADTLTRSFSDLKDHSETEPKPSSSTPRLERTASQALMRQLKEKTHPAGGEGTAKPSSRLSASNEPETPENPRSKKTANSWSPPTWMIVAGVALVALGAAAYWKRVPLRARVAALRARLERS